MGYGWQRVAVVHHHATVGGGVIFIYVAFMFLQQTVT